MKTVDMFLELIKKNEGSFQFASGNMNFNVLQSHVGTGRYIYSARGPFDEKLYTRLDLAYKLIAVYVDGILYIPDKYNWMSALGLWNESECVSENTRFFSDEIMRMHEYAVENILPGFYEGLDTDGIEIPKKQAMHEARQALFSGGTEYRPEINSFFLDARDFAEIICGIKTLEDTVMKHLESETEDWEREKAFAESVNKLIRENVIALDWELRLAGAINGLDAKNVSVEFEFQGKASIEKLPPREILLTLTANTEFRQDSFRRYKDWVRLLEALDIPNGIDRNGKHVHLTCADIRKISYRGKPLYERETA